MCISIYPKFLAREGTCKGDARCGTHAVPRVTSVNPGACKYNRQDEPWEGIFSSIRTRTSEHETSTTSTRIPWFISEAKKPVLVLQKNTHMPSILGAEKIVSV